MLAESDCHQVDVRLLETVDLMRGQLAVEKVLVVFQNVFIFNGDGPPLTGVMEQAMSQIP